MTNLVLAFIFSLLLLLLNLLSPHRHLTSLPSSFSSTSLLSLHLHNNLLLFLVPTQEQEALQQAEERCAQLVQAGRELEAQVAQLDLRVEQEEDVNAQLTSQRHTLQTECCSLRQDLEELESALSAVEKDKQVIRRRQVVVHHQLFVFIYYFHVQYFV